MIKDDSRGMINDNILEYKKRGKKMRLSDRNGKEYLKRAKETMKRIAGIKGVKVNGGRVKPFLFQLPIVYPVGSPTLHHHFLDPGH